AHVVLSSACLIHICCKISVCPVVPNTRETPSPMPTVIVPHPVKHCKRVVVYLPDESDAWTATEIRAAIDTALSLKYGNGIAHMDGHHGPSKVEACAESQEVDLRQTPPDTHVDAEVGRPRKFRRLDLKPMLAREFY
ncbi:MAG: hypothetical protein ACKPKO_55495, partial [Candidatus Fonsibacter sp.]